MKIFLRNISILIFPFLAMILINEIVRPTIKETKHSTSGITAMNSAARITDKCTWICHNDTNYCMMNHVKYLEPYSNYTNILYFGIIGMLKMTGNYWLANIVFLVILIPSLIWYFIIKSMSMQHQINKLKNKQ
ncbi:hypothetical protein ACKGJN_11325 [Gillisia sp. Q332]|uniref:hypothetical protein n=1 Tax=Gillisia xinjiangensis TaxID=3384765 RepID=UPI00391DE301